MKNVIITGASGFLGSAAVKVFLNKGYRVIALSHDIKNSRLTPDANLKEFAVDLTDAQKVKTVIDEVIKEYGNVFACLLIAGGYAGGKPEDTVISAIKQQLALNFDTAYNVAQPLYVHFKSNKEGRIIFIGSQPALNPKKAAWSLPYALSKSLLFQLAAVYNEDAKESGVAASVVVPSTIDTAANRASMPDADFSKWVKPEQLAETMEILCSESAAAWREPIVKVYNNSY